VADGGNVSCRKRNIKMGNILFFFWGQCLMTRNMGVMSTGQEKKGVVAKELETFGQSQKENVAAICASL